MIGDSVVQPLNALEYNLHLSLKLLGFYQFYNLFGDLLGRKRLVYSLYHIGYKVVTRYLTQPQSLTVLLLYNVIGTTLLMQGNRSTEGDKLLHPTHINPIAIGVTYLRRAGYNNN